MYIENIIIRIIHLKFFSQIIFLPVREEKIIGMPEDFIETCVTCISLLIESYAM